MVAACNSLGFKYMTGSQPLPLNSIDSPTLKFDKLKSVPNHGNVGNDVIPSPILNLPVGI